MRQLVRPPQVQSDKQVPVLLKVAEPSSNHFLVYRPNTGLQARSEKLKDLLRKHTKVEPAEAEKWWTDKYESSLTTCNHAYW